MVITLDARYDLYVANYDTSGSAVDSFERAYCKALRGIADKLRLPVSIDIGSYDGPSSSTHTERPGSDEDFEQTLWQAAHDAIEEHAPGKWRVKPGAIAAEASRLKEMAREYHAISK